MQNEFYFCNFHLFYTDTVLRLATSSTCQIWGWTNTMEVEFLYAAGSWRPQPRPLASQSNRNCCPIMIRLKSSLPDTEKIQPWDANSSISQVDKHVQYEKENSVWFSMSFSGDQPERQRQIQVLRKRFRGPVFIVTFHTSTLNSRLTFLWR